ncbi:hypothetical protein [Spiroplasma endosymbiont of Villa modesta]|uniref:hypothetical protein n=1 Tax=Spiroplasma endosymbiont of Villa modesta TaxID=3066293 RepID=UPI00313BDE29
MAKKYTPEIKEKLLQYLQDGKSYGEIKKETGISKTTIWIWKKKARKNELKAKHSVNSAPRDILEAAINIAEINCDNNENQNYKEEFLNQQQTINLLSVNINKQIENNYFDNSEEDSDSERLVIDEDYKEEVNIWRPWEESEIKQNSEESLVIELKKDQLKYII